MCIIVGVICTFMIYVSLESRSTHLQSLSPQSLVFTCAYARPNVESDIQTDLCRRGRGGGGVRGVR